MSAVKNILKSIFRNKRIGQKLEGSRVEQILSELEEVQNKKRRMTDYIEELNRKGELYEQYEHLDSETINKINKLGEQAKEIEQKKQNLRGRLISNNAALNRLSNYEDDIPDFIKEMKIAEKRRRETESHMLYLQEERALLEEERDSLISGYRFLKGFSLFFIICMGVSLLISFIMLQILREKIWFILSGLVVIMVCIVIMIVLVKERLEKEIKDNGILQQKAVQYLNKSKIRFFNQTHYLEFQYRKLGVDSVAKLELYYNRYLKNKNNERIYLQMNDALTDIEEEILGILHSKNILVEHLDDWTDWTLEPKRFNEIKQFMKEKEKVQDQLKALQTYEEEMIKELFILATDEQLKVEIDKGIQELKLENMLDKISASA